MEVHDHPDHHNPKNWKEYFLEYLMIVLAVITGFFAESLREHLGEQSKKNEYLTSLMTELKYDTTQYKNVMQKIMYLRPVLDSMYVNARESKRFNYVLQARWNTPVNEEHLSYLPALTTIEQLKNSGNLSLIGNRDIAHQVMIYETYIKTHLQPHNAILQVSADNIYSQEDAICNEADFSNKLDEIMLHHEHGEKSEQYEMQIMVRDPIVLNKFANSFISYKSRIYGHSDIVAKANDIATELIELIHKELN